MCTWHHRVAPSCSTIVRGTIGTIAAGMAPHHVIDAEGREHDGDQDEDDDALSIRSDVPFVREVENGGVC